ncbi:MAG: response regulator [Saprospiraceae bacterium]
MAEMELLKRKIDRERNARKQAEAILEQKAIELFHANEQLRKLNESLEQKVEERTRGLEASELKYRMIMENMDLGLVELDLNKKIMRAYDKFCQMTGYKAEELEGQLIHEILLPEESLKILAVADEKRKKGESGVFELQLKRKNGNLLWVLVSRAPIYDLNNVLVGSLGIHFDMTTRKKLEEDLANAKAVAEKAQEAESQFLARMSHEIRTPLNAIIGMSHILFDTEPTKAQQEYLSILKSSADILLALINDILDFSKIQAGEIAVNPKEFDLSGLIRSLQKTFQHKLEEKPVEVKVDIDASLNNLLIGDDLLLNQVLLNLLGNAAKFTAEGEIGVKVKLLEKIEKKCLLEFTVYDTGIGVPADKLDLIFENFKQADGEVRHKFGGTGLGLAITKQLVELQGGTIRAQSTLGKGTAFVFTIAYEDTGVVASMTTKELPKLTDIKVANSRILVAEDNIMNRKYVATLFKKWDIPIHFAHNGREAVEKAQQERFDLILMDISMPEMDGYEATIAIRNTKNPNQHTPIVALTASALVTKKEKAFQIGMTDYMPKPFKPMHLLQKIQNYIKPEQTSLKEMEENTTFTFNDKLDVATLTVLYEDDLEYAADLFETFLDYTVKELEPLKALIEAEDWVNTKSLAHKLKPTFSMVGLPQLEAKMLEIELNALEQAHKKTMQGLYEEVVESLNAFIPIIAEDLVKMKKITFIDKPRGQS